MPSIAQSSRDEKPLRQHGAYDAVPEKQRGRGRRLAATGVTLACFASSMSVGVLAVFSDQESVGANAFATGSIDISTTPSSAVVSFDNMMPGDQVTNDLEVTNEGGEQLRYALSSEATNNDEKDLRDQLNLMVREADATTPSTPCDDFDGASLYNGDLSGDGGEIFGDAQQGASSGDRPLGGNASETLCFRVALPLSTGNQFQDAASTATFTFDAEQTANNP